MTRLLTQDFPLRPDLTIRLTLPIELTKEDADRLCAFVQSLAFVAGLRADGALTKTDVTWAASREDPR
jgi:hypothetical protein